MKTEQFLKELKKLVEDLKAQDVVVMDLSELPTCGRYHLVITATSPPHINALVREIKKFAKGKIQHVEGVLARQWVLIDCGDVIVHIFTQQAREFYDIERLWEM